MRTVRSRCTDLKVLVRADHNLGIECVSKAPEGFLPTESGSMPEGILHLHYEVLPKSFGHFHQGF